MNITPLLSYNALTSGITTGALVVVSFIIEVPAVPLVVLFVPIAKAGLSEMASGKAIIVPKTNNAAMVFFVEVSLPLATLGSFIGK
jgi:hypothetical protein